MDLIRDWSSIRTHFRRCFSSTLHVTIASVSAEGQPCATPIGSLFLNRNQTGFYFEKYPKHLPKHADENNNICILSVDSSKWFWLKALFKGKFAHYPGMKLYGNLGPKRAATEKEIARLTRRMRYTRGLKGHQFLWPRMQDVREVKFERVEAIRFGSMTDHL